MNRPFIAFLMLVMLMLQSVTGAYAFANDAVNDMSHCDHTQVSAHNDDTVASSCCDHCQHDNGCATSCSLCFPAMSSILFLAYSTDHESFAFVAKQLRDRDYPPLNPPPIA
jgi:hypothetical protein